MRLILGLLAALVLGASYLGTLLWTIFGVGAGVQWLSNQLGVGPQWASVFVNFLAIAAVTPGSIILARLVFSKEGTYTFTPLPKSRVTTIVAASALLGLLVAAIVFQAFQSPVSFSFLGRISGVNTALTENHLPLALFWSASIPAIFLVPTVWLFQHKRTNEA